MKLEATKTFTYGSFIQSVRKLSALLSYEIDLIRQSDFTSLKDLHEEKNNLLAELERYKKKFPPELHQSKKDLPQQQKQQLDAVIKEFNEISSENFKEMLKLKEVNETIVSFISDMLSEDEHVGYGKKERPHQAKNHSIVINEEA